MLTRDQQRAQHAYHCVAEVPKEQLRDYKIFVNDLGANILRSGLAVAIARLEHEAIGRKAANAERFLCHLAKAGTPGLATEGGELGASVRELEVAKYMLATREMLKVATWFKRAVQATFKE